jgi:type II secretory pathway pseudopilin PulG
MTKTRQIRNSRKPSQEGYILVAVIFMLAILIISLAVAAPTVKKEIQRDRELEAMHRGKQYIRAVQLYYRRFHAFPPNVDALVKTNEIRFLRKKYVDLTTGKEDWKPILFGQAKTQTLGFFGQPIAGAGSAGGSMLAGIGPGGGNGVAGATGATPIGGALTSGTGGISLFAPTDGTGAATPGSASPGASPTTSPTTSPGTSPAQAGVPGAASGTGTSGSTDANGNPVPGTAAGLTGQSFGGAGIIGFSPAGTSQSILVYKKKNHYNEWEFVYDPLLEQMMQGGNAGTIGQPASATSSPIGGSSGIGIGTGSGFNTGSGAGGSPGGINPGATNPGAGSPTSQPPPTQ